MFPEEMEAAAVYEYELNFHNQLKARVMDTGQVIQVVKEVTLDPPTEKAKARMQDPATIEAFADNIVATHAQGAERDPSGFASYPVTLRVGRGASSVEVVLSPAEVRAALSAYMARIPPEPSPFAKTAMKTSAVRPTNAATAPIRKRRWMVSRGGSSDSASIGAIRPARARLPMRRRTSRSRKVLPDRKKPIAVTKIEPLTETRTDDEDGIVSHRNPTTSTIERPQMKMTTVDRMSAGA